MFQTAFSPDEHPNPLIAYAPGGVVTPDQASLTLLAEQGFFYEICVFHRGDRTIYFSSTTGHKTQPPTDMLEQLGEHFCFIPSTLKVDGDDEGGELAA